MRNVYTVDLDPEQVGLLVADLPQVAEQIAGELESFADTLEAVAGKE